MDIKRLTSALLGFPLVVLILTFGNKYVVDIFLMIVAMLGMQEYFNAVAKESKPVRWVGYLSCVAIALVHILPENVPEQINKMIVLIAIPLINLILFAHVIITNMKINFKDIAYTLFGIIYVIGNILFIALLRGAEHGIILVWYAIIAAWGTDIFAYVVGKRIGKHKFTEVSPNKTIEGCIGGVIGAVLLSIVYTIVCNKIWNLQINYIFITVISVILSIIGQLGDLAESSIKRYTEIKDTSNLIPGHGGMLDRIDSVLFIAPIAYFLLSFI